LTAPLRKVLNSGVPEEFTNLCRLLGLRVRDNGIGVPAEIKDTLFQPFFTTKPTGEGTGLDLSIS
jgi:signal transduction histidine kinase